MKHIVYGNGESRPKDKIIGGEWTTTWGCNAIYRDIAVDNLVSVDYPMQQEIYESGYAMNNKCWFSDCELLPAGLRGVANIAGRGVLEDLKRRIPIGDLTGGRVFPPFF